MESAFGIEHGISKGLSVNQARGLARVRESGAPLQRFHARSRLEAHTQGQWHGAELAARRKAGKSPAHTGGYTPHDRQGFGAKVDAHASSQFLQQGPRRRKLP